MFMLQQPLEPVDMANGVTLYLFGDQTYDGQSKLRRLFQHRNNPLLNDFLKRACHVIVHEIGSLPPNDRNSFPTFSSIEDVVSYEEMGKPCAALDMSTTCIYQLGTFLR